MNIVFGVIGDQPHRELQIATRRSLQYEKASSGISPPDNSLLAPCSHSPRCGAIALILLPEKLGDAERETGNSLYMSLLAGN
jgi:hypothetical protein